MKRFTVRGTNQGFVCTHCGSTVLPLVNGSVRNHCPICLWSLHVDVDPGDRSATCKGSMEPVAVESSGRKGWVIVHRCTACGEVRRNRAALDDAAQPDAYDEIVRLSVEGMHA